MFGRLSFADKDTNPFETSVSFGIGGRGVIPSRPNDVFGLGYFYNDIYSDDFTDDTLSFKGYSQGGEAFYNLAITPAAKFTLSCQYLTPSLKNLDDAIVLNGRFQLVF